MPVVHHATSELHVKLVYYGPGLGGKTTNLRWIHEHSRTDLRGRLMSLNTETERTLFFDLLPVYLGSFKGYTIRLHLCTVPGQIAYDSTRRLVLRHVDGVVFVVDSQRGAIDANVESIRNLEDNLIRQGDDPTSMPLLVQYNKRDLPDVMSREELRAELNIPAGVPEIDAVASQGVGVFESLKTLTRACLALTEDPRKLPNGRSPSILPGARASMYPGGRPPALGSISVPKAPRTPSFSLDDDDTSTD